MRDKFQTKENFYIILDYYDDNLNNFVEEKSKFEKKIFPPNLIKKIFEQLNLVFKELKNNNFYHNRIFPNNILIKYSNEEKTNFDSCLTDFGLILEYEDSDEDSDSKNGPGTDIFCPPEIELPGDPCKSALFSVGITIYYLYLGKLPYDDKKRRKLNYNFKFEVEMYRKDIKLEHLLRLLLNKNSHERILLEDYFNHPFFKQYEY